MQNTIDKAQLRQNELIRKGAEYEEQDLLNYHGIEISNKMIKEKLL